MTSILQKVGLKKKVDPVEQAKEWQRKIKKEMRQADREIRELEREEKKFIKECQKTAKMGSRAGSAVKTIAKNVVMARKAKERACMTRAQLNSVSMTLAHQMSTIKLAKCMNKSSEVMAAMNDAIKLPQLNKEMMSMAREMERAGLIEELIGDAMDDVMGGDELESEADEEVNKVLEELTMGMFEGQTEVTNKALPAREEVTQEKEEEVGEEDNEALDDMRSRLQAL
ncbi:hypothetical protein TrCOL_g10994 [Triparma columacea]|uniref:Charged multivesicular body protein 3 n=1 Tax=Triparma columacea TaxID=722753 RepID=A0A9W7G952_9STRA|nr:hypothetical protein TrCOL_g10994 [Triparma columacea]